MTTKPPNWLMTVARILALIFVIAISIYIFTIREEAEKLTAYGYPGIFLLSFLAYATVILPAPGLAVVFTMGAVFNPIGVALAAGSGAALGELTGYMAGFSGRAVIERIDIYERLTKWITKNGPLTIIFLSAIPNPLFDIAGAAAGALKMPLLRFLFWCWIGVTIKMFIFALIGSFSLSKLFG